MEPISARPWYKKKRYLIPLVLVASLVIGSAISADPTQQSPVQPAAAVEAKLPSVQPVVPSQQVSAPAPVKQITQPQPSASALSNDNYYTNVDGKQVHSPAYSPSSCSSIGASAECRDGTCSFSQNRRGTCSHHGGVAEWL